MDIQADDVFVATPPPEHKSWKRKKMRRVIAVIDGVVCYSDGSNKNRFCKVATFQRWASKPVVEKVH